MTAPGGYGFGAARGWQATGQGLMNIAQLLLQQREQQRQRADAKQQRDVEMGRLRAQEMQSPEAMSLEDAANRYGIAKVSADENVPITFNAPPPVTRMGPDNKAVTYQDARPYETSTGVVMSPQAGRERGEALQGIGTIAQANIQRGLQKGYAAEDRVTEKAYAAEDLKQKVAALVKAGVPEDKAEAVALGGPPSVLFPDTKKTTSAPGPGITQEVKEFYGAKDEDGYNAWPPGTSPQWRADAVRAFMENKPMPKPPTPRPEEVPASLFGAFQTPEMQEPGWSVRGQGSRHAPQAPPTMTPTAAVPAPAGATLGVREVTQDQADYLQAKGQWDPQRYKVVR